MTRLFFLASRLHPGASSMAPSWWLSGLMWKSSPAATAAVSIFYCFAEMFRLLFLLPIFLAHVSALVSLYLGAWSIFSLITLFFRARLFSSVDVRDHIRIFVHTACCRSRPRGESGWRQCRARFPLITPRRLPGLFFSEDYSVAQFFFGSASSSSVIFLSW